MTADTTQHKRPDGAETGPGAPAAPVPSDAPLLDLRGLRCPLPALRLAKRLEVLAPGARLSVLADDPLAPLDIRHLCRAANHEIQEEARADGLFGALIRRAAPAAP